MNGRIYIITFKQQTLDADEDHDKDDDVSNDDSIEMEE